MRSGKIKENIRFMIRGGGWVAEKEGITFFGLGDYSFFIKSKLKFEIFNDKILILWGFTEKSDF